MPLILISHAHPVYWYISQILQKLQHKPPVISSSKEAWIWSVLSWEYSCGNGEQASQHLGIGPITCLWNPTDSWYSSGMPQRRSISCLEVTSDLGLLAIAPTANTTAVLDKDSFRWLPVLLCLHKNDRSSGCSSAFSMLLPKSFLCCPLFLLLLLLWLGLQGTQWFTGSYSPLRSSFLGFQTALTQ